MARPKTFEIAKLVRHENGTMEVHFDANSRAKQAIFVTSYGAEIRLKNPRDSYQISDKVVEISIRG